jgi:hypothetical protein
MDEMVQEAKKLDQKYANRIIRHNKKGNYYMILGITAFCCSIFPELEGKLVVEYARNGNKHTRFIDDLLGLDPNTMKPRFELVPEEGEINREFNILFGKSEGSGK